MRENLEEVGIRTGNVFFIEGFFPAICGLVLHHGPAPVVHPDEVFHLRDLVFKDGAKFTGCAGQPYVEAGSLNMRSYPVDPFMIGMMLVVGKVILQDKQQNNAHGYAQGKAQNIEHGIEFVFQEYPDKEFEVVAEHGGRV
jgi:hypothetical protein